MHSPFLALIEKGRYVLQTATYGEFSTLIHQRQQRAPLPADVSIEVTHRCPLECQHCYNNLPMNDSPARRQEMTFANTSACSTNSPVSVASGFCIPARNFRPKRFPRYLYRSQKARLSHHPLHQWDLITPRIADHLAEYRPFSIEITL